MWMIDVSGCVRTVVAGRRGREPVARPCRAFLPVRYLSGYPVVAINYAAAQGGGPELLKTKLSLYGMALLISKVLMVK